MPSAALADQIATRAAVAGLSPARDVVEACAAYLEILAKWNRRMNLTALAIDPPSDAAIDRLLLEPLAAARHIRLTDHYLLDVGSGGGSPALPLKIAAPWVRLTMVESREKKAAFLREAARSLGLANVAVEAVRIEDLDLAGSVDVVSVRAVKLNDQTTRKLSDLPASGKRVFWFRSPDESAEFVGFRVSGRYPLPGGPSELVILEAAVDHDA